MTEIEYILDCYKWLSNYFNYLYKFSKYYFEKYNEFINQLNEFFNANLSGRDDKARDQINNEIGRQYGLEFPDIPRKKLLDILVNDYNHNLKIIKSKLKEKGF